VCPYSCKFFAWLVSRSRCWTADRLQRRGLPAPASCPLCSQEEPETIRHLLLGCVVAREVWTWALSRWGKLGWLPAADEDLVSWWTSRPGQGASQRDLWTSLILVFWSIWTHRNDVVFNSARPAVLAIKTKIREEYGRWRLARLFRSDSFGFPEPVELWRQLGE
jgi:hypothetical protein